MQRVSKGDFLIVIEDEFNPLLPGSLVHQYRNIENTFGLILSASNRAVYMGSTFIFQSLPKSVKAVQQHGYTVAIYGYWLYG